MIHVRHSTEEPCCGFWNLNADPSFLTDSYTRPWNTFYWNSVLSQTFTSCHKCRCILLGQITHLFLLQIVINILFIETRMGPRFNSWMRSRSWGGMRRDVSRKDTAARRQSSESLHEKRGDCVESWQKEDTKLVLSAGEPLTGGSWLMALPLRGPQLKGGARKMRSGGGVVVISLLWSRSPG